MYKGAQCPYTLTYTLYLLMRVRFAPSPTGFLHLGGLRTALFNFLIARKHPEGRFILRIEDTDRTRIVDTAVEGLQRTLQWAGINYDEGPDKPAKYGPYIQSQRLPFYQEHSREIIENGRAYRCFCSKERLELIKGISGAGRYDGNCRMIPKKESEARANNNEPFVLRFKAPDDIAAVPVIDLVFGPLKSNTIDDVILMKSDGFPTYHFANIIDDHLMKIDLVMRGAEWIPSTPLHGLLYDAFGWKAPKFAHLPLLINPDGSKLSKRQDSAHVSHYISSGFLPEALINFVAFLGWNPKSEREIFGLDELIKEFDLKGLNQSDATVNLDKLKWLNRQHLKSQAMSNDKLIKDLEGLVMNKFNLTYSEDYLRQVIKLSVERIFFLKDVIDLCPYFFIDPDYTADLSDLHTNKLVNDHLTSLLRMKSYTEITSMPLLRLIMTGCRVGPSIQETVKILGDETCRRRFEKFKSCLENK